MKNKLICQTTNYDCGPTSLTNALRFLFERAEIPPAALKQIWAVGNDSYAASGAPGREGTSKAALRYLADWFEEYGARCGLPVRAAFLDMEAARVAEGGAVLNCLHGGGCAVMRCVHGGTGHYVLLTRMLEDGAIGLFDPFDECADPGDPDCRFIYDRPKEMNRAVCMERLNLQDGSDYSMGPPEKRELLLLWRSDRGTEGTT